MGVLTVGGVRRDQGAPSQRLFNFDYGMRVDVYALRVDEEEGQAWIECNSGVWLLPPSLWKWALSAEEEASRAGGFPEGVFPFRAYFQYTARGEIQVDMYRPRAS